MDRTTAPPPQAATYSGPPPPYSAASTNVVISQQPVYGAQSFGECPVRTKCPSCKADIITSTHYEVGTFTWAAVAVLCFLGLSLFCCLIPLCLNSCKDVVHKCPNCRFTIGRYNRM